MFAIGSRIFKMIRQYNKTTLQFIATIAVSLICGIGIGHYRLPPHAQIAAAKNWVEDQFQGAQPSYLGEAELLQFSFTDPLIFGERLYPSITSLEGIRQSNESIYLPVQHFFSAYKEIQLEGQQTLQLDGGKTTVTEVVYQLADREYRAFAYGPILSKPQNKRAVLIIPGTGLNQSHGIYEQDPTNYHDGVLKAFNAGFDVYVFIKPNEDILAFHDGRGKLDDAFFINWHLNRGGSYSASYIAQSLAFSKFLKEKYSQLVVAGLSQGGGAALLNSLQSEPSAVVIASAYSVINEKTEWAGWQQIIIPGISSILRSDSLITRINQMRTEFFFSWGKKEWLIGHFRGWDWGGDLVFRRRRGFLSGSWQSCGTLLRLS
jgi:hypothetical protein